MLRSRILIFAAVVLAHAATSFVTLFGAYQAGLPALYFGVMFIPSLLLRFISLRLLGLTDDDYPDLGALGALVGVPDGSPLGLVLWLVANSLLWVASASCLWLAGHRAWRKVAQVNGRPTRFRGDTN